MNGILNDSTVVKEYGFIKPLIHKIDSIIDVCIRDCHNRHFPTFEYECAYDIQLTNFGNNEIIKLTVSDKSMGLFELVKKVKIARQNGFNFFQILRLTIIIYSMLSHKKVHYCLKFRIPVMHKQFFRNISQNSEYAELHCNDSNNSFPVACRGWMINQ